MKEMSPLALQRYKSKWPNGVSTSNIGRVILEIFVDCRNRRMDTETTHAYIYENVKNIGCDMEEWFLLYMIQTITGVLCTVRDDNLQLHPKSNLFCMFM